MTSLPPPPLSSGTPPPMDFRSDDDEYPYPDDDERFDDEVPSFDDDDVTIPVPDDPIPCDVMTGNPISSIGNSPNHKKSNHIDEKVAANLRTIEMESQNDKAEPASPIHSSCHVTQSTTEEVEEDDNETSVSIDLELNLENQPEETVSRIQLQSQSPQSEDVEIPQLVESPTNLSLENEDPVQEFESEPVFSTPSLEVETLLEKEIETAETNIPDNDFGDFVSPSENVVLDDLIERTGSIEYSIDAPCDDTEVIGNVDEIPEEEDSAAAETNINEPAKHISAEEDDTERNEEVVDNSFTVSELPLQEEEISFAADFNQFANFDDFPAVPAATNQDLQSNIDFVRSNIQLEDDFGDDDEDDDEFGDFASSAPVLAIPEPPTSQPPDFKMPDIDITKAEDILKSMFVLRSEEEAPGNVTVKTLVDIKSFETTALTEGYQWSKSRSNKCLVKCLGIDPRNILYGTNWNPEMPRFAANLGFSPLQPIRPTIATTPLSPTPNPAVMAMPISTPATVTATSIGIMPGDVPAAQFDWDSSGLVNPLHALQAHTLLLDLEQLVVVASLENTKTASNSTAPAARMAVPSPIYQHRLRDDGSAAANGCSYHQGILGGGGGEGGGEGENSAFNEDRYSPFKAFQQESYESTQTRLNIPELVGTSVGTKDMESKKQEIHQTRSEEQEKIDKIPIELIPERQTTMPLKDLAADLIQPPFPSSLRETHIFTPITGVTPVSREIIPAVEAPPEGSIVVKEYRDVEYNPFVGIGALGETKTEINTDSPSPSVGLSIPEITEPVAATIPPFKPADSVSTTSASQFSIDEDDFSEFQSVPAPPNNMPTLRNNSVVFEPKSAMMVQPPASVNIPPSIPNANPLQPLSVTNLTSMVAAKTNQGLHANPRTGADILMPSILMPQQVGMSSSSMQSSSSVLKPDIRWPDNSSMEIGKSELERIDEIFSGKRDTNSSHLNTKSIVTQKEGANHDDDEWTDFISGDIQVTAPSSSTTNGEDEWTDFVSSAPSGPNFMPWQAPLPNSYQFNRPPNSGQPELRFVDPSPFFISSAPGLPSRVNGVSSMDPKRNNAK